MITPPGITYEPMTAFPRGTFFSLVTKSYAEIADDRFLKGTRNGDDQIFDQPEIIGACTIVTCLDGEPIGTFSYDPRPFPNAIVGQNCILPQHRGKGLGSLQMRRLLAILKAKGFQKVTVTTGDIPFFEPGQRMYSACGFTEVRRYIDHLQRPSIDYEMQLL